ncbi:MAG: class I SAM-dependent DNA methyltransferase [Acidobacteriota bacterium]
MSNHHEHANLIWQIADLLRGPYRPPQYERVMLPMTVLRRFDCVLASTRAKVLAEYERRKGGKLSDEALDKVLNNAAGQRFHNHSPLTFQQLKGDPDNIDKHLVSYITGFSKNVRTIFEFFEFETEIEKMREANILYLVVSKFSEVDLHPDKVPNEEMGLIFENLIRRFNELANETAGDHFTPREVIRLMVNILFINDDELLATPGTVRKLLDPAGGTGGMLAEAQNYLREHHSEARLYVYGQDYNKRAYATAASDMLMKQVDHNGGGDNIRFGDTFTDDQFPDGKFDYFLTNPPFGVDWKKQQNEIQREYEKSGFGGRFGAGLPRINDGAFLFLQHMISKFEPELPDQLKHGSRLAIVFSGSPLFSGGAGSGESNIRKWIIENDWLEAIIALPEQMFYNTGIGTYIWIVTNRKEKRRKDKIQLLDARESYIPMRRSLGDKRRKIGEGRDGEPDQIGDIVKLYGRFTETDTSKIFDNDDFGYTRVTVERPLRLRYNLATSDLKLFLEDKEVKKLGEDRNTEIAEALKVLVTHAPFIDDAKFLSALAKRLSFRMSKGLLKSLRMLLGISNAMAEPVCDLKPEDLPLTDSLVLADRDILPDPALRDFENMSLKEDIDAYFRREVFPHVPDAWMDRSKDKVGYEINFNRHFYRYTPPRPLEAIDADLKQAEEEVLRLLNEVTT